MKDLKGLLAYCVAGLVVSPGYAAIVLVEDNRKSLELDLTTGLETTTLPQQPFVYSNGEAFSGNVIFANGAARRRGNTISNDIFDIVFEVTNASETLDISGYLSSNDLSGIGFNTNCETTPFNVSAIDSTRVGLTSISAGTETGLFETGLFPLSDGDIDGASCTNFSSGGIALNPGLYRIVAQTLYEEDAFFDTDIFSLRLTFTSNVTAVPLPATLPLFSTLLLGGITLSRFKKAAPNFT